MADDEIGERLGAERVLEPEDALDVEVIRRLVQQQHVGRARQLARDGEALEPAAGQVAHARARVREAGARERHRHAEPGGGRPGSGRSRARRSPPPPRPPRASTVVVGREARVLRHVAEARPAAERAAAAVRRLEPREDAEQGGLARAVGTDEPDAVALGEAERELLEERRGAEGLGEALRRRAGPVGVTRRADGAPRGAERPAPSISASLSGRRSRLIRASSRSAALQVRTRRDHARVTGRCARV